MIASGAQVRASRALLGWSQMDLAEAAGVNVETVRHWEQQHARRLHPVRATKGVGPQRIAKALHRAGVTLLHDPPGVRVNPSTYETDIKPPILARREKYRKSDSKRAQRECRTEFAMLVRQIPKVPW